MHSSIHGGFTALVAALILAATPIQAGAEEALATVNSHPITQQAFELYSARRPQSEDSPDAILEEMVTVELLYQTAVADGYDQDPDFLVELDLQRRNMLASLAINAYIETNPVTDAQVRAEYDKQMAGLSKYEYKARHILLESEEAARGVIADLDGGADFIALAKEKSTGPSGADGGDLGWFSPARMVKPFGDAVVAAEIGRHGKEPVQTDFGWHVILVEERRDLALPDYDRTAGQIREVMTAEAVRDHLQRLRDEATVKLN